MIKAIKGAADNIRNIAIIAHVDHGKTTLVDSMFRQSGIFRDNEQVRERVMDSNEIERERGITILSKNTSVNYKGVKINIVDTPGHADFGGEVERVLKMVNGVLLLVDSFEGPMPQTRFVLRKALELELVPIVVINKADRPDARADEVIDEILNLFIELDAGDEQLDFPVIFASARDGWAMPDGVMPPAGIDGPGAENGQVPADNPVGHANLAPLFEAIIKTVPPPSGYPDMPFQALISNIDYDDYVGRIAIGRIERGAARRAQQVVVCGKKDHNEKINRLYTFEGLRRIEAETAGFGDIVAIAGLGEIEIGDTVCDVEAPEPLSFVNIDEPTITMTFSVNNSPLAGREGSLLTSRHIRDRLFREVRTNVSMRVEETDTPDAFKVSGRGELHLSILIETMRRQGYEFSVSKPSAVIRVDEGVMFEPIERLVTDAPDDFTGVIIEKLGSRKAEMVDIRKREGGYTRLEFLIPARGLIGFRSEFLTDTRGNGIMNHVFNGFGPHRGDITNRTRGSIVAWENGEASAYGLFNAQERGVLFISPGFYVYEGMVVGECSRDGDMAINVCKKKHATNIRAAGSDEAVRLTPPRVLSLEQALDYITDDEIIEVTPKNIRIRKRILNTEQRMKSRNKPTAQ